jgi:SAM-dependent methyltransferase
LSQQLVFDQRQYEALNAAREEVLRRLLSNLGPLSATGKPTAIDIGCGAGYFSGVLDTLGFDVLGVDAREANIQECQRRFANLRFAVTDAENLDLTAKGTFDLVLCFGLLYHLENPFRAIRNIHAVTGRVLIVESMCAPGAKPTMELLDEFRAEDQGVNYVAFYPTEACLAKMLYRAGFPSVYRFRVLPDDPNYRSTNRRHRARTMLVASKGVLSVSDLEKFAEPEQPWDIWDISATSWRTKVSGIGRSVRSAGRHRSS